MTMAEYDAILCPTEADFRAWTRSLIERADRLNALLVRKYPQIFKTQAVEELALGE